MTDQEINGFRWSIKETMRILAEAGPSLGKPQEEIDLMNGPMLEFVDEICDLALRASQSEAVRPAPDLVARCREVLDWKRTGTLKGEALRSLAEREWRAKDERNELRLAETQTADEAMAFVISTTATDLRVQLAPADFIKMVEKLPDAVGVPAYWAEWPSPSAPSSEPSPSTR